MNPLQICVEEVCTRFSLPGFSVAVGDAQGISSAQSGLTSNDVLFPIASVTKPFTASRVVALAREGALGLDRALTEQLPGFALSDSQASAQLTPRDALCHFSGLPPHTWSWVYGDVDRRTWMLERLPHLASVGPHREKHRYSNILYAVLGLLIEYVTGRSWETDLLGYTQFPPTLLTPETLPLAPPPFARTQQGNEAIPPVVVKKNHLIGPASEGMATMSDLVRWGLAFLESPDRSEMETPHCRISGEGAHPSMGPLFYGAGWRLDRVNGRPRIWHSGQCSGYASLLSLDPERGRVMAAACNLNGSVEVLHAVDLFLREEIDPDWAKIPCRQRASEELPLAPSDMLPVGCYSNPGYGLLEVTKGPLGLETRFQHSASAPLRVHAKRGAVLTLPEYRAHFPVRMDQRGSLYVRFEPQVPEIEFVPV